MNQYWLMEIGPLTHWPLGDLHAILKLQFSILFYWLVSSHRLRRMPWGECQETLLTISRQAPSHYLSQCWPSSMSPYVITRPQSVNEQTLMKIEWKYNNCHFRQCIENVVSIIAAILPWPPCVKKKRIHWKRTIHTDPKYMLGSSESISVLLHVTSESCVSNNISNFVTVHNVMA